MKTKRSTRLLSVVLVLALCLSLVPMSVFAADIPDVNLFTDSTSINWSYLRYRLLIPAGVSVPTSTSEYRILNAEEATVATETSSKGVNSAVELEYDVLYTYQVKSARNAYRSFVTVGTFTLHKPNNLAKDGTVTVSEELTIADVIDAIYDPASSVPKDQLTLCVAKIPVTNEDLATFAASAFNVSFQLRYDGGKLDDGYYDVCYSNAVKLNVEDPRQDPQLTAHDGVVLVDPANLSAVTLSDFVDAIYDDSNVIAKENVVLCIEKIPVTAEKLGEYLAGAASLLNASFQLGFAGDETYKPAYSNSVSIRLADINANTVMEVSEEPITITYGDDLVAAVLAANAVTVKPVNTADETNIELTAENLTVTPSTPKASEELQPVTVKFTGAEIGGVTYTACEGTINVLVNKAKTTVKVSSATVTYDGEAHPLTVTCPTDYITLTAGVDSKAMGFLSMDFGGSQEMKDFLLELLGVNPEEGIKVKELAEIISKANAKLQDPDWFTKFAINIISAAGGKDIVDSLTELVKVLDKLPLEKVNATIYFGKEPVNVGVYETTAITINPNYETAVSVGVLVIKPQTVKKDAKLSWNASLPTGSVLSWTDAQTFDFGAVVVDGQNAPVAEAKAVCRTVGTTFTGKSVDSTDVVRTPGVYCQSATAEGYLSVPAARMYTIQRQSVKINATKAALAADGSPKEISFTVTTEDGKTETANAVSAAVKVTYVGLTDSGKTYNSTVAPTEPGAYTVTFTYEGTEELAGSMKVVTLEITTPEPSRVATVIRSILKIFKK